MVLIFSGISSQRPLVTAVGGCSGVSFMFVWRKISTLVWL